jgi:putative DNA primase/helicase
MFKCPSYYAAKGGHDLTDFFIKFDLELPDLTDLLADAVTIEKQKEPEIASGPARFFGGRNGNKFMPALLSRAIMEDLSIISDPLTGLVYRWNGKHWEEYDLKYIRKKALRMLGDEGNSARAADAANMVSDLSVLPMGRKMNDGDSVIGLQNGMFNLLNGSLLPHAKDYYSTHCLGVSFDPGHVQDCPRWLKFLDETVQDPGAIRELQKYFGYCLTRETRYEKMLLLYGPGGDGKSTLMKVLRQLVGETNCSDIPMGDLEDQFYRSLLVDKLLNMNAEVDSKAMQSGVVKAIVSGDPISASFKNQKPFSYIPCCKLVYAMNRMPRMLDNSDGFFRKVMIIEMKGQFVKSGKADIFLLDALLKELPGIFAWALAGLEMLREEGFNPSRSMQDSLYEYKRTNNNILYYIEKHVVEDAGAKVAKGKVWEDYVKKCRLYGLQPFGEPHFWKEFSRLLRDLDIPIRDGKVKDEYAQSGRTNAFVGIKLIGEKLEESPEDGDSSSPAPHLAEPDS